VNGTRNVLEAARQAGTVKRVVLTSSCAAVTWQDAKSHEGGEEYVWTEDDWQEDNTLEKGP
jgi:dihydroflavonol-4-reductase